MTYPTELGVKLLVQLILKFDVIAHDFVFIVLFFGMFVYM